MLTTGILLLIDFYVYQAVKTSLSTASKTRKWILKGYWFIVGITLSGMFMGIFLSMGRLIRTIIFVWFFIHYFSKVFAIPFLFIDDFRRILKLISKKIGRYKPDVSLEKTKIKEVKKGMSRSEFLSKTGLAAASIPFVTMNYGMISYNVYDYHVKRRTIYLPNLPKSFDGIRIGQISDIHAGSFYDKLSVKGGIDLLNAEKCDLVFFTGDLVNDKTSEMGNYMDVFNKIKAPLGIFSIYGNHDYGDYVSWPTLEAKKKNLDDLAVVHKNLGWNLLKNEHHIIKQGGDELAIIGVENWSASSRFPKKGRMDLATKNTDNAAVKLLLSHDPSHWRTEVTKLYKDIDIMFSGHTHGMQFGVEFGDFKWSPIQYIYPEWSGLYEKEHQKLYVNVGYGFLGYPGRIGIAPEITIFELKHG